MVEQALQDFDACKHRQFPLAVLDQAWQVVGLQVAYGGEESVEIFVRDIWAAVKWLVVDVFHLQGLDETINFRACVFEDHLRRSNKLVECTGIFYAILASRWRAFHFEILE